MSVYDLLNEHAGLSQKEADNLFVINEEAEGWRLKARGTYLEAETFKAIIGLTKDYGGEYYREERHPCFFIPKPKPQPPEGVAPHLITIQNQQSEPEYNLAKSLKSRLGQLVPCLKDAEGLIIDGYHRLKVNPNAWTVKLDHIKTPVDRALARMAANFCRRRYTSEEMRDDIGLLIGAGLTVKDIAEITGVSERTIYRYMPQEQKKLEPEQLKESRKKPDIVPAVTESEISRQHPSFYSVQEAIMSEMKPCEGCGLQVHRSRLNLKNGKLLCPKCRGEKPPEKPKPQVTEYKAKEKWEQRAAVMKPMVSKQEIAVLEELAARGHKVESQVHVCLAETVIDFVVDGIPFYLDGKYVHLNRDWKDEEIREKLSSRLGRTVYGISYEKFTKTGAKEIVDLMEETLKWEK